MENASSLSIFTFQNFSMIQKINLNKIFHLYFCSQDSKHFETPTPTFKGLSFRNAKDSFFLHFHTFVGMRLNLVTFFQPISFFVAPTFIMNPRFKVMIYLPNTLTNIFSKPHGKRKINWFERKLTQI
jgi:hypothetical protein